MAEPCGDEHQVERLTLTNDLVGDVRVALFHVLRLCHNYENDDAPRLSPRQVLRSRQIAGTISRADAPRQRGTADQVPQVRVFRCWEHGRGARTARPGLPGD